MFFAEHRLFFVPMAVSLNTVKLFAKITRFDFDFSYSVQFFD